MKLEKVTALALWEVNENGKLLYSLMIDLFYCIILLNNFKEKENAQDIISKCFY